MRAVAVLTSGLPASTGAATLWGALWRLALFVGVIVLAYFATKWLAKTRRGLSVGGSLSVLEAAAVGQNAQVAIVRAGARCFLVGVTKETVTPIAELNAEDLPAEQQAAPMKVWEYFSRARKESRHDGDK